jgi:hypothetical protein
MMSFQANCYGWNNTSIKQNKVPVVGCSIDRRAVDVANERMHNDNLEAPICLFCARVLTYDACDDTRGIKKYTSLNTDRTKLGDMTVAATDELVSVLATAAAHCCTNCGMTGEFESLPGRVRQDTCATP